MPAFLLPAIGAAANVVGGAIGNALGAEDRDAQQRMIAQIMAEYDGISPPEAQAIAAEQLGPSAQEGVQGQMDPRLKAEQMDTMSTLDAYSKDGGTAETRAAMNRILGDLARQEGAGRNAILGNMRARGTSGSGAELAMQLSNQQASADRASAQGMDQAAAQQRRMLEAAMGKGRMAGDMRGQEFGELSAAARAKDMISQYNATNRTNANLYNNQMGDRRFNQRLQLANGKAGAAQIGAKAAGDRSDRAGAMGAGIGQGVNEGLASFGSSGTGLKSPAPAAPTYTGSYGYNPDDEMDGPWRKP